MYYLYTFHSTHAALFMERSLMEADIKVKIIPVPRAISSSCGLSARIDDVDYQKVQNVLAQKQIEVDGVYTMTDKGKVEPFPGEKS